MAASWIHRSIVWSSCCLVVIMCVSTYFLPAAAQSTDNNPTYCLSYHSVSFSCNCHACDCSTCYSCGCSAKAWGSCSYDSCNSCWCSPICRCCRDDNCGSPCNCRSTCCDTCSRVECANSVKVHATAIMPTRLSIISISTDSAITVTGSNFVSTGTISCRLTRESDGLVFTVAASFADSTHVSCPISTLTLTPATYVVTVSLDATSYTINDPPLTVTVYNCPSTTSTDHQCSGQGTCGIDGVCTCNAGFWGSGCENSCPVGLDALICSGNAFVNGTCNSDGTCQCRPGSVGVACEIVCPGVNVRTGDKSGSCSGHGVCLRDESCLCYNGYKGAACDVNGTCAATGDPDCRCVNDKWGPSCSNDCEPCSSAHGVCSPLDGKCFCNQGYFGSQCDQACPGGASSPCSGHLVSGMSSCTTNGTCVCQYGWYGAACENSCPGGASTPCSQHGRCLLEGSCSCDYGFAGSDCSLTCPLGSSSGSNLICSGHGDCVIHSNSGASDVAMCTCQRGWYGQACDSSCSGCLSTGSTGWCDAVTGDCICQYAYFGPACNQTCPGGVSSPCSLHGLCNRAGHCDCLPGYFGDHCEQLCPSPTSSPSSPTSSPQPCSLHGTCTSNGTCVCDPSYTGVDCSARYCPYDCYQHGRCVDGSCLCDDNWSGPYCSTMKGSNTTSIIHGVVSFKTSSISVEERWPSFPLLLQRTNGSVGRITVYVSTSGVNALADIDFVSLQNVAVTWSDADSSDKSVSLSLIQDTLTEDDELFVVDLTTMVLGGAVIGSPSSVNVTILANSGGGGGGGGSGLDGVIVQITLRLNVSLTSMPTGSAAQQQFLVTFIEELASCFQVSNERVLIVLFAAASDAVGASYLTLQLLPPSSSSSSTRLNNALSSPGVANELLHAIANPSSCVYSGTTTHLVDLSYMPTVLTINPSSSSSSSSVSTTAIVVIVVVCSVVLLAMVAACVIMYRRRKQLSEWMLWKLAGMRFRPLHEETTAAEPNEDGLAMEQTNYIVD